MNGNIFPYLNGNYYYHAKMNDQSIKIMKIYFLSKMNEIYSFVGENDNFLSC